MKIKFRLLTAATIAVLLSLTAAPSAFAEPAVDPVQAEINSLLAKFPGGVQTGTGEISWDGGRAVLTLGGSTQATLAAVGSCASGSFCAYSSSSLGGTKMSFSSCTATNSLGPIGNSPRSIANARSSGTVYAYNSGGSSVASVAAGSYANVAVTATRLGC